MGFGVWGLGILTGTFGPQSVGVRALGFRMRGIVAADVEVRVGLARMGAL